MAPGPPLNSVSPLNTVPSVSGAWKQTEPGEWPGVCRATQLRPRDLERVAVGDGVVRRRCPGRPCSQSIRSSPVQVDRRVHQRPGNRPRRGCGRRGRG